MLPDSGGEKKKYSNHQDYYLSSAPTKTLHTQPQTPQTQAGDIDRSGAAIKLIRMTSGGNANGSGPSGSGSGFFQQQQHPKRRQDDEGPPPSSSEQNQQHRKLLRLSSAQGQDDALAAGVVPPVTVVLDGRCICHRVHLGRHSGYRSLAAALRRMFVDEDEDDGSGTAAADVVEGQGGGLVDLSNAVPGHVVAYEDMEDDLLLAGDLNWKDFVRVAKRIRIIPAKSSNRRTTTTKQCGGGAAR